MRVRHFEERDRAALSSMAQDSGFPYCAPDGPMVEECMVAVDGDDLPVAAVAAERILQVYGWLRQDIHPAAKMAAIRALHDRLAPALVERGYLEVNAFLPPTICQQFGRRLERSFGWVKNWASWAVRL
jgi:hypothetical protein